MQSPGISIDITKKAGAANDVGTLKLDIRDFSLQPPKKVFGLILIKNEIEIEFDLAVNFNNYESPPLNIRTEAVSVEVVL